MFSLVLFGTFSFLTYNAVNSLFNGFSPEPDDDDNEKLCFKLLITATPQVSTAAAIPLTPRQLLLPKQPLSSSSPLRLPQLRLLRMLSIPLMLPLLLCIRVWHFSVIRQT